MNCLRIAVTLQSTDAALVPDPAFLVASKRCQSAILQVRVDPHGASLDLLCDAASLRQIFGPD